MELDGIAVFVKVIQAGSFSGAARLLGMPNTTVSAKVAALEKRLGVTLIRRTTRKLHVTPEGEAYFRRCVTALDEIKLAETELASSQKGPQGVLRITAAVDVGHTLLPPLVRRFLKKYPQMNVELLVTNRVVDLVAEGVDLAIRAGELEDSTMIARKWVSAQMGLWASPKFIKRFGSPSHPKDLSRFECIRFSSFPGNSLELNHGREKVKVAWSGRVSADELETIKTFAFLEQGIALLPEYLCEEEAKSGKLIRILPQWSWGVGHFSVVYPAQRFVSPNVEAFLSLLAEK